MYEQLQECIEKLIKGDLDQVWVILTLLHKDLWFNLGMEDEEVKKSTHLLGEFFKKNPQKLVKGRRNLKDTVLKEWGNLLLNSSEPGGERYREYNDNQLVPLKPAQAEAVQFPTKLEYFINYYYEIARPIERFIFEIKKMHDKKGTHGVNKLILFYANLFASSDSATRTALHKSGDFFLKEISNQFFQTIDQVLQTLQNEKEEKPVDTPLQGTENIQLFNDFLKYVIDQDSKTILDAFSADDKAMRENTLEFKLFYKDIKRKAKNKAHFHQVHFHVEFIKKYIRLTDPVQQWIWLNLMAQQQEQLRIELDKKNWFDKNIKPRERYLSSEQIKKNRHLTNKQIQAFDQYFNHPNL